MTVSNLHMPPVRESDIMLFLKLIYLHLLLLHYVGQLEFVGEVDLAPSIVAVR